MQQNSDDSMFLRNKNNLIELEYALDYMPRILKPRLFTLYIFLFKKFFFEYNEKKFDATYSELASNFLADQKSIMSISTVTRNVNDLVELDLVEREGGNVGKANSYRVTRPSSYPAVIKILEAIKKEKDKKLEQNNLEKSDHFSNKEKRLEILKRDNYKCSYCLVTLSQEDFELDHIIPKNKGGLNFESNLTSVCRKCNIEKSTKDANDFLQELYRRKIIGRTDFANQIIKISELQFIYSGLIKA